LKVAIVAKSSISDYSTSVYVIVHSKKNKHYIDIQAKCYCKMQLKNVVQDEKQVTSTADPNLFPEARCNKFLYLYTKSAAAIDFFPSNARTHTNRRDERKNFRPEEQ